MLKTLQFNEQEGEYEQWFEEYPFVFQSEVAAMREQLPSTPDSFRLEVAIGTDRFAKALRISEAAEPAPNMRVQAEKSGISIRDAEPEYLPDHDRCQFLKLNDISSN